MASRTTTVIISVDTEFGAGGCFENPAVNKPIAESGIYCEIDGKSHGLGFLLETFDRFGLKATFFVEALHTLCLGDEPMRRVANDIVASGHDIQLHLHPVWSAWAGAQSPEQVLAQLSGDSMAGRTIDEAERLIALGLDAFRRWNLPRPLALRAGNLQADVTVYRAMARLGLRLASNLGMGIYRPPEQELQLFAGRHWISGVLESPVTSYVDHRIGARAHIKTLTVTGSSYEETRHLLAAARACGMDEVIILSHPHEYVKQINGRHPRCVPNKVNQDRLVRLCWYLRHNADQFETTTLRATAQRWLAAPATPNRLLEVPLRAAVKRMAVNRMNDAFSWF